MAELSEKPRTEAAECCAPEARAECCEPSEKAECCESESSNCGCAAGQPDAEEIRDAVRSRDAAAAASVGSRKPGS